MCTGAPTERPELQIDEMNAMLLGELEARGTARSSPTRGLLPRPAPRQAHSDQQSFVEAELSFSDHGSEEGKIVATPTEQDEQFPKGDC